MRLTNIFPFPLTHTRLCSPLHIPFVGPVAARVNTRSNIAWPTANKAFLIPFRLNSFENVSAISVINGAAVSGNIDAGIYNSNGVRLVSRGSIAQSGAGGTQSMSWTAMLLPPGNYYAAIAMDNGTGQVGAYNTGVVASLRALGIKEAASSFPLPATLTPAQMTADFLPGFFLSLTDRPTVSNGFGLDATLAPLDTIHSLSWESVGVSMFMRSATTIAGATLAGWPTANWGCLIPFTLSRRTRFQRIFSLNATASGNIDLGIYDFNRNKLVSTGSTAMSGNSTIQAIAIDITLGPGRYYMAVAIDNTTGGVMRWSPSGDDFGFIASETLWGSSSFPLPVTFTINQFPTNLPMIGLSKGTVI